MTAKVLKPIVTIKDLREDDFIKFLNKNTDKTLEGQIYGIINNLIGVRLTKENMIKTIEISWFNFDDIQIFYSGGKIIE